MLKNNFARNLKFLREERGLTTRDFAKKIFVHPATLGCYETGKAYPSFEALLCIIEALNASADDLIFGKLSNIDNRSHATYPLFASNLWHLMRERKLSCRQLSATTKIAAPMILGYLHQKFFPRYKNLARLAQFFKITVEELLGEGST